MASGNTSAAFSLTKRPMNTNKGTFGCKPKRSHKAALLAALPSATVVARKDRYMSLTYGNYYATELEQELNTGSDDDLWGSIWN